MRQGRRMPWREGPGRSVSDASISVLIVPKPADADAVS